MTPPRTIKLTEEQADSLRHMLGINRPDVRSPRPTRDYAAMSHGDQHWTQLEALGLVERYAIDEHYVWLRTTAAGREAAFASHRQIRLSRSARRYARYLDLCDAVPNLTFRDFLTHPQFAQIRRQA